MNRNLISFAVILATGLFLNNVYAKNEQQMTPPKPLENKVYESMIGSWKAESEMMGQKMDDVLNISWGPNHQFILVELKAQGKDKPENKYEGLGIFGVDKSGQAKTWWFDSWGVENVAKGSGQFKGNKLVLKDSKKDFSETRTFEMNGDEMIMTGKGTMHGKPFDQKVIYHKT